MPSLFERNLQIWRDHASGTIPLDWHPPFYRNRVESKGYPFWDELNPLYESLGDGGFDEILLLFGLNAENAPTIYCWCCLVFSHKFNHDCHKDFFSAINRNEPISHSI